MLLFNWFSKFLQACSPLKKNINEWHKQKINLSFNIDWKYGNVEKSDSFSMPVASNNTISEIVIEGHMFWHSYNIKLTRLLCINLLSLKIPKLLILADFNNKEAKNVTFLLKVIK